MLFYPVWWIYWIKLITVPCRVGKPVLALFMLLGKNFAYINFNDNLLLENWNEDLVMRMLDDVYPAIILLFGPSHGVRYRI